MRKVVASAYRKIRTACAHSVFPTIATSPTTTTTTAAFISTSLFTFMKRGRSNSPPNGMTPTTMKTEETKTFTSISPSQSGSSSRERKASDSPSPSPPTASPHAATDRAALKAYSSATAPPPSACGVAPPPVKTMKEFHRSPLVVSSLKEKKTEEGIWKEVTPFVRRTKAGDFKPSHMYKMITWNVAGLRGILRKDADVLTRLMEAEQPDVLCLQETRLNPAEEKENGRLGMVPHYRFVDHVSHTKKGYSGTRVYLHEKRLLQELQAVTTCGFAFPDDAKWQQPPQDDPLKAEDDPQVVSSMARKKRKLEEEKESAGADPSTSTGVTLLPPKDARCGSDQVYWPPEIEGRLQTVWLQPVLSFPATPKKEDPHRSRSRSPSRGRKEAEEAVASSSSPETPFFPSLALINTYIPNSGMGLDRLPYRIDHFDTAMRSYLRDIQTQCHTNAEKVWRQQADKGGKLSTRQMNASTSHKDAASTASSPGVASLPFPSGIIWCGDLNVAERDFDRYYAGTWGKMQECSGFTPEERFSFRETLEQLGGACDSFRHLYPNAGPTYTFWSARINGRVKGLGWRLDYFVVSKNLIPFVVDVFPMPEIQASDHCPVQMWLKKRI